MNTIHDLRDEFAALAADAPADDAIRAAMAVGIARREKRRRTAALVSVAAAVVLVAGGIGVTRGLLSGGSGPARPAAPNAVVPVPDVPLPADTQLIRHQLKPVTSPVTATPPEGLTGMVWMQSPGRLAVVYFDRAAAAGGRVVVSTDASPESTSVGYVITDAADDPVWTFGQGGTKAAQVTKRGTMVGGRDATLATAPSGATDVLGFPAAERLSWQLPDGRYIHVWATGLATRDSSPDTALKDFAESITDTPQTLRRAVGIGLTLPGLTADSSMNVPVVGGFTPEYLMMCPPGVDPFAVTYSSSSGSGTAAVSGETGAAESMSIEPGAAGESVTAGGSSSERCLGVVVFPTDTATNLGESESLEMSVAGTTVRVFSGPGVHAGTVDLGNGLTAVVGAPASVQLSDADLAALAASVRLSPDVDILPVDVSGGGGLGGTGTESGSSSAVVSSSSTAAISESATALPLPSGEAALAGSATDPNGAMPLQVLSSEGHTVDISVQQGARLGEIEFSLRNISDQAVTLDSVQVGGATVGGKTVVSPGVTLHTARMRLDNLPSDAERPFADAVFPAMIAPGATVRLQLEFAIGQCSAIVALDLPVDLGFRTGDTSTCSSGDGRINLAAEWGVNDWVATLAQHFCR